MIKIFDTTLRDGEQAPGFSMNLQEKILLAKQLERLGVDVIEAGFPVASPEDFQSVKLIAETLREPEICALARCNEKDIETAISALSSAKKPRVHVFIATSDIHLEYKLKMTREEALKKAIMGVKMARSFTNMVDFSPEDATRSDREFLVKILEEAIKAGADTLNIPDTVGYSTPADFGDLIAFLMENVRGIENVIVSTHCHNDLGLAVANSLAGVLNGARQIECTINGIGERAGNASLEEVVMAMKVRHDAFPFATKINTREIVPTSKLLSQITGQEVQANKAIVGKNAFAHEAGIHQHGMMANRMTYEIMKPEDLGHGKTQIVFGKHSGRNAIAKRLEELGILVEREMLDKVFEKFKKLADKKKNIYDEDLILLAIDYEGPQSYELVSASAIAEIGGRASAIVVVKIDGEPIHARSEGAGVVSALYGAIMNATGMSGDLKEFKINALTQDRDALAMVHIKWQDTEAKEWYGQASDTDVTMAAAYALVDVFNRMKVREKHII